MARIRFDDVREWLFGAALPFWAENGAGGPVAFHETLTLDGAPGPGDMRRVRVIARQVYAFSHAHLMRWDGPALERARAGVEALMSHVWLGEERGWARLLGADGDVTDARADLYDFAFILFALGWWMRASGEREVQPYANRTLELIEAKMAHPSGRGHVHILPVVGAYQQNPHMHLTEACMALHTATGDPRWMAKARECVALFRDRFHDPETGHLTEFFDADWRPDPDRGDSVEPGHQLEWAWILRHYQDGAGEDQSDRVRSLVEAAERTGVSPKSGLVYGAVSKSGAVTDPRHRIWPQTERIKGNLALFELTGEDRSAQIAAAAHDLLDRYLAPAPAGGWIDVLSEDGEPLSADMPASTLYHLELAFAELLRLRDRLEA